VGLDGAGIERLPTLDQRAIAAATADARTAPIGDSRRIYRNGVVPFLNQTAIALGGQVGMLVKDLVAVLIAARGCGA
jgi:hypothetical protein